ncbi:MAG TPA: efflux RND transporter periplasmic adaptor subunit [Longimicrobiales bacterium]
MKAVNIATLLAALTIAACGHDTPPAQVKASVDVQGAKHVVSASSAAGITWAAAVADPYARATLSTKLMGTVTAVQVHEGDLVPAGQPLVTIDARDLNARDAQVVAGIAEAEAMQREAASNAQRMRMLFAEDAATRAQLDAAETGLARANAAVRSATAARAELSATRGYAVIRAPFAGQITARMVDPGAFAAPGSPLISIQDARRLRVVGTVAPAAIQQLRRGAVVDVQIEGRPGRGVVEAIVPTSGNLYRVNVIVDNREGNYLPGSAAAIGVPQAVRTMVSIPATAIQRAGDMTGVYVQGESGAHLRWIQLGTRSGLNVEVLAGLRPGETIVIPATAGGAQ